jgi:type IV secretory pathway TrbL component
MENEYPFQLQDLNRELESEIEEGDEIDEEDFEEIKRKAPEPPSFPIATVILALLIDTVKLFTFGFLGIVTALAGFILVRIYLMGKMSFMKRFLYRKTVVAAAKNLIPVVGAFLGSWTWLILRAYGKQKERTGQIIDAVERLILRYGKK